MVTAVAAAAGRLEGRPVLVMGEGMAGCRRNLGNVGDGHRPADDAGRLDYTDGRVRHTHGGIAMTGRIGAALCATLLVGNASSDVYRVKNTRDTGTHSLRWAITEANSRTGPDNIKFAATLAGSTIRPKTPLPVITDAGLRINGDIDADGAPDIALRGGLLGTGDGLKIRGNDCTILGLSVGSFPEYGVYARKVTGLNISACHLGANLEGTKEAVNGRWSLFAEECARVMVRPLRPNDMNVLGIGGKPGWSTVGVFLSDCSECDISRNHVSITRSGSEHFGSDGAGVVIQGNKPSGLGNRARFNTVGGVDWGVIVQNSRNNVVEGNHFGLSPSGNLIPIGRCGVALWIAAANNHIGVRGGTPNYFAACGEAGIQIADQSRANDIRNNRFGMTAGGFGQRRLGVGVLVFGDAQADNDIGGPSALDGNCFTCGTETGTGVGVRVDAPVKTRVRNNTFGELPQGGTVDGQRTAVHVTGGPVWVASNSISRATRGVVVETAEGDARVRGNIFSHCRDGVRILPGAACHLGDLGNAETNDDGGNTFDRFSMTWFIRNGTADPIMAEGNNFGTLWGAKIEAKLWDDTDDASLGAVDFDPLAGAVSPKGEGIIGVSGLMALPTAAGAQVSFMLAGAATVEARVMNIAGRPVRTLCRAKELQAGGNTLLWDARSDNGLRAPGGVYLVEVIARGEDGGQARALGQVRVR